MDPGARLVVLLAGNDDVSAALIVAALEAPVMGKVEGAIGPPAGIDGDVHRSSRARAGPLVWRSLLSDIAHRESPCVASFLTMCRQMPGGGSPSRRAAARLDSIRRSAPAARAGPPAAPAAPESARLPAARLQRRPA